MAISEHITPRAGAKPWPFMNPTDARRDDLSDLSRRMLGALKASEDILGLAAQYRAPEQARAREVYEQVRATIAAAGERTRAAEPITIPLSLDIPALIGLDKIVGRLEPHSLEYLAFEALGDALRAGIGAALDRPASDGRALAWKLRQLGDEITPLPGEPFEVNQDDRRRLALLVADLVRFGLIDPASASGRA